MAPRNPEPPGVQTLDELAAIATALGGSAAGGPLSAPERELIERVADTPVPAATLTRTRNAILDGGDPLGAALAATRSAEAKRDAGQFFTDAGTVGAMLDWVARQEPARVVDAGCGSGRFAVRAAQLLPDAEIVAVDTDPLATLITRANLAVAAERSRLAPVRVRHEDFLDLSLPAQSGVTAFVGNPPYVRHHRLSPETKRRGQAIARALGRPISGLAGLHAYFLMQIARLSAPGDVGCLITSSEWLDVGYGASLRGLLAGPLGLQSLHLRAIDGAGEFEDALTSAVIACFSPGSDGATAGIDEIRDGEAFDLGRARRTVTRECLRASPKWGGLLRRSAQPSTKAADGAPLGSIFKVSRGVATGHNRFFVMTPEQAAWHSLRPWVTPVVSSAAEIQAADGVLRRDTARKVLLDIPRDARVAAAPELTAYLREGEEMGVPERYLCSHRNPWWAVQPPAPAPVVATYMGRRPPVFALNPDGLPLLNIALGLQPREGLPPETLPVLVDWLNRHAADFSGQGRTYQGGLQKFEPRELEALTIPAAALTGSP